jgi:hypothetical protein
VLQGFGHRVRLVPLGSLTSHFHQKDVRHSL